MNQLLAQVFGRLPIGWMQLSFNKARLAAALAGVAFANLLVFVQLGMLGALMSTIDATYAPFRADILISASDARTMSDASPVSRRTLFQALSAPGIEAAAPLYLAATEWNTPEGDIALLQVYALPPDAERFAGEAIRPLLANLIPRDTVLIDRAVRGVDAARLGDPVPRTPYRFELRNQGVEAVGTLKLGGGFSADGALVTSETTFLRLFSQRTVEAPNHILIDVAPGTDLSLAVEGLQARLKGEPLLIRTLEEAIRDDRRYQSTERPIGVIFGFGVLIGIIVGVVIVYQILSTDVADHLKEYATFKAMGYDQRFFLSIIFEQALLLAVLGFIPGFILANLLYGGLSSVTGLPVDMEISRAVAVLIGTLVACSLSGAIATRRLAAADPAELF